MADKPEISPPEMRVRLRLGEMFQFNVNGKPRLDVDYSLVDPRDLKPSDLGKLTGTRVEAPAEPRQSYAKLNGKTTDGKFEATARVYCQIEWEYRTPVPVDDWNAPPIAEGVLWNSPKGCRAWLIMMDILYQLPKQFLDGLGDLYIVRVKDLFQGKARAMHWPFDRRAVLIANNTVLSLDPFAPRPTPADEKFARTFVHELAHVILANRAFASNDRFLLALRSLMGQWGLLLATIGSPIIVGAGAFFLSPLQALLGHKPEHDFLSDYAAKTGWVTNAIHWGNPFMALVDKPQLPNVLTGHQFFGANPLVRLRNTKLGEKVTHAALEKAGFPASNPDYAATDVHEDFAESLAYLAFNPGWAGDRPTFKARAEFFDKHKIWPAGASVEVGGYLEKWAKSNSPNRLPDMSKWSVYFGPYAGKVAGPKNTGETNPSSGRPGVRSMKASRSLVAAKVTPAARTSEDDSDDGAIGDGEGQKSPIFDDAKEILAQRDGFVVYERLTEAYDAVAEPVVAKVRQEIEQLAVPPRDLTPFELLRTAELHGEGVTLLQKAEGTTREGCEPGFVAMNGDQELFTVISVDKRGVIKQLAGAVAELPTKNHTYDVGELRYLWKHERKARSWKNGPSSVPPDKVDEVMRAVIRLWGETTAPSKRDLSIGAGLFAEYLDFLAPGSSKKARGISDWLLDDIRAYCERQDSVRSYRLGDGCKVGDVVWLRKPDRLGILTRVGSKGEPIDAVVNGGDGVGYVGEEEAAAKLLHGLDPKKIVWVWEPLGTRLNA